MFPEPCCRLSEVLLNNWRVQKGSAVTAQLSALLAEGRTKEHQKVVKRKEAKKVPAAGDDKGPSLDELFQQVQDETNRKLPTRGKRQLQVASGKKPSKSK